MEWYQKLSTKRMDESGFYRKSSARTEFQRDVDEIIFSKAFKRLADKTSVHALKNKNDHTRTRLTHSLEVASVGRSLGTLLGEKLYTYEWKNKWDHAKFEDKGFTVSNFGTVLTASCLAHDIGNTPFGHAGEKAIQEWFKHHENELKDSNIGEEYNDFVYFDGNAQGFRVLSRLGDKSRDFGLNLTYATLGTFVKYPWRSSHNKAKDKKKYGLISSEREKFQQIAKNLNLRNKDNCWLRHPLNYLVEAADDICYLIADIEDAIELKIITLSDVEEHLQAICDSSQQIKSKTEEDKYKYYRAKTIDILVHEVIEFFMKNLLVVEHPICCPLQQLLITLPALKQEEELGPLLKGDIEAIIEDRSFKYKEPLKKIREISDQKIYYSRSKLELEEAGTRIIQGLLERMIPTALEKPNHLSMSQNLLTNLIPEFEKGRNLNKYQRIQLVTDYISGMTDEYALNLHRKFKGISL